MTPEQIAQIVGQLGASGIFAAGLIVVTRTFYNHLMDDQRIMRDRITALEKRLDEVDRQAGIAQR